MGIHYPNNQEINVSFDNLSLFNSLFLYSFFWGVDNSFLFFRLISVNLLAILPLVFKNIGLVLFGVLSRVYQSPVTRSRYFLSKKSAVKSHPALFLGIDDFRASSSFRKTYG